MGGEPVSLPDTDVVVAASPLLSIVIPLYNEVDSLPHLREALEDVLQRENLDAEVLFVDDGSRDGSSELLDQYVEGNSTFQVLHQRRNKGKSAALDAGFRYARGKYVVTMDADLQDDPNEIPNLITKLEEGYDLVSGWKKKRYDPITKTIPSKFFNFTARLASGVKLHDFNCGLKIYRNEVVKEIRVYGEQHRFIPVIAGSQGWRIGELAVQHHARKWGKTKYGISRFVEGALDLLSVIFLTRFTSSPMYLFGSFGILSLFAGFVILAYLSILWFQGQGIGHRPLFFLGILMIIVGAQFFSIGFLGEMVSHMRINVQPPEPESSWKGKKG